MAKIRKGGSLSSLKADEFNRHVDASDAYHRTKALSEGQPPAFATQDTNQIKVKNVSCGNRRAGEILEVCSDVLAEVNRQSLWFSAAAPAGQNCFGILLHPLEENEIGPVQISGATAALVNVTSLAHMRASVSPGEPVLQSTSSASAPVRLIHAPLATGEQLLCVLIEAPCQSSGVAPTTTTTTTTPVPVCDGRCRWIWDEAGQKWTLDNDGCNPTTPEPTTTGEPTTTEEPTTTDEPATTTTPAPQSCGCPTSTTTTSEPTTTTPGPDCKCTYPLFCGTEDGDCTHTGCTTGDVNPQIPCTTTTTTSTTTSTTTTTNEPTTTPDCNTTTTADPGTPPPPCTLGCDWVVLFGSWRKVSSDCTIDCPCPAPSGAAEECDTAHTPCVQQPPPPTTQPPPPSCTGNCVFWWTFFGWIKTSDGCHGVRTACFCRPPSSDGTVCGPYTVGCESPPSEPTTTLPPPVTTTQHPCYTTTGAPTTTIAPTTTSTTTTTPAPCQRSCTWRWNSSSEEWDLDDDPCTGDCPCSSPPFDGAGDCDEVAQTPCQMQSTTTSTTTTTTSTTTTTTTTSTTTTSTTPCPIYQIFCGGVEPHCVQIFLECGEMTCEECLEGVCEEDPFNCPYFDNLPACNTAKDAYCASQPTTTDAPTTSPPTTTEEPPPPTTGDPPTTPPP